MELIDIVLIAVIIGIFGLVGFYIHRSKKKGKKCIGCPDSCACSQRNCSGGCSGCK